MTWRRGVSLLSSKHSAVPAMTVTWVARYSVKNGKQGPLQERGMIDRFRIWAKGGEGGNGCCSIRRGRSDPRGKPDGGNGGRGGDVILECSPSVWDFSHLQHHLKAKRGLHGLPKKQAGHRGSDKIVQVPVGTVIHLASGEMPSFLVDKVEGLDPWDISEVAGNPRATSSVHNVPASLMDDVDVPVRDDEDKLCFSSSLFHPEGSRPVETVELEQTFTSSGVEVDKDSGEMEAHEELIDEDNKVKLSVAELTEPGQRLLVASGGPGGLGNVALHPMSRKPNKKNDDENLDHLKSGKPGTESVLILELKSLADVGLVGMPNAGKSTLLGALSRAQPAVGDYAFTTLRPSVGQLEYDDYFSVKVADIPGLIKGAHENRGLGHAFLRHIERTRVLAYVLDLGATLNGKKGVSPWEQLRDLVLELEHYQERLSERPSLVVANKIDEEGAESVFEELKRRVQGVSIFPICAILQDGVPELKAGLRCLIDGTETQNVDLSKIVVD